MRDDDLTFEQLVERGWMLTGATRRSLPQPICLTFCLCHGGETITCVEGCGPTRNVAIDFVRSGATEWLKEARTEQERGAQATLPCWRRWP